MRNWITVVAISAAVFFAGCAANKLKRAERLISKAEELGAKWHVDTIMVEVPIVVPSVRVDSIIVSKPGDTVVITKDRLKLKYVRLRGDTVFVAAECAADTIIKKVPVTVVKTIKAKGGIKWWWLVVAAAGGMFLGRFVMKALLG